MNVKLTGQTFYKNKLLHKGLEFAANKSGTFMAGAALAFSTLRPLSILATPKTDRENKKLACAKSIASAGINYTIMYGLTNVLAKGIKGIEENPNAYLKPNTIKKLEEAGKPLSASKKYQFIAQLYKLGLAVAMAIPKSALTCALIPPIMNKFLKGRNENKVVNNRTNLELENSKFKNKKITFKGLNPLSKGIGKSMDNPTMQKMADRFKDTNYAMHIPVIGDILATGAFIHQTNKSKKIKEDRKKVLNYNAAISTGLSIGASYVVDKALDKPTEKFIKKFSEVNKDAPKLAKYVEGIKIAKPTLIMGSIYYLAIPLVSTFWAERIDNKRGKGVKE